MNKKLLMEKVKKGFILYIIVLILSYYIQSNFGTILLANVSGIGLFWAVIGTIYALIVAFVMVEVWGQFNVFGESIGKESQTIITLWNFTDYLDNLDVSRSMQDALAGYIDSVAGKEWSDLAKTVRVSQTSPSLSKIREVINMIPVKGERSAIAFSSIISAYENLLDARGRRIESGLHRLPPMVRALFFMISGLFAFGYMIIGFDNMILYLATLSALFAIVVLVYNIIFDMDVPFEGIFNVDSEALTLAKGYILKTKHRKSST